MKYGRSLYFHLLTWPNEKSQPKLKATLGSRFFRRSRSREEQKPAKRRPRHSPARLPGVRRQRVTPEPSLSPLPGPVSYGRAPRALCPQPPGPGPSGRVRPAPPRHRASLAAGSAATRRAPLPSLRVTATPAARELSPHSTLESSLYLLPQAAASSAPP